MHDHQAETERNRRQDFKIQEGFGAAAAHFSDVPQVHDSARHRAKNDRLDQHFLEFDESIAQRFEAHGKCRESAVEFSR